MVWQLWQVMGFSPLDFCGKKPHTHFGSGVRLTPRFGLSPQPVSAGSGALNVSYDLGWWFNRDNYGLTGSGEADRDRNSHRCFHPFLKPRSSGAFVFNSQSFSLADQSAVCCFFWNALTRSVIPNTNSRSSPTRPKGLNVPLIVSVPPTLGNSTVMIACPVGGGGGTKLSLFLRPFDASL